MKRYLNSFFITSFLYLLFGIVFVYAINEIKIESKKEEIITKISLNSVAVQKVEEVIEKPIIEQKPEEVIEKLVEKPAPKKIEKKIVEKPKKIEKPIEKVVEKPIEKVVEKPIEKVVDKPIENISEKVVENVVETPAPAPKESKAEVVAPTVNKAELDNLENIYLSKVKAKIEKNKTYPKAAKKLNQTGKVLVSFDILKDGKIINIRIIKNSNFEKLDSASIELLTNIGFFEAIPNELNKTVWNIQIPINYQIN